MNLILVVLAAVLAGARADCEACVAGRCHSQRTLIEGFHVSDQMAIDRHNDILYVQLNSNMNTAFFLEDRKIRLVQSLSTSGMTVDQEQHVLYTADGNYTVYRYEPDSNTQEALTDIKTHDEAHLLLFHKNILYYTAKCCKGLHCIDEEKSTGHFLELNEYNITDFLLDADDNIYFVADNTIYMYVQTGTYDDNPKVVTQNKYLLSVDKYGEVYFVDASMNAIYKMDISTKQLVDYAAYKRGTMEKFVFDDDHNIVFHDSADGTVNIWKPEDTYCSIVSPHDKYVIRTVSDNACNDPMLEYPHMRILDWPTRT